MVVGGCQSDGTRSNRSESLEFMVGDLADDLADVWSDLKSGLRYYEKGRIEDAAHEWRANFDIHWGEHAADAIAVLQEWIARHCWEAD